MPMQASYTSAYLLAAAIEKAGEATPEAILQAFPGVSATAPGEGTVTVQDNHHTTHTVSLGRANDRALYDVIERFAPREPDPFPAGDRAGVEDPDLPAARDELSGEAVACWSRSSLRG